MTGASGATSQIRQEILLALQLMWMVFLYFQWRIFIKMQTLPLDEITLTSSASLTNVTFQAFSVDKIGITNQASDDSFAVDFVANVTGHCSS